MPQVMSSLSKSKNIPVFLTLLVCLLLFGCASAPPEEQSKGELQSEQSPVTTEIEQPSDPDLPEIKLDSDLIYEILLGEIAVNRGDLQVGAESLLRAAQASRDYRLAERATRVALGGQLFSQAHKAALLWSELQPHAKRPQEALAMIHAENGDIEQAVSILSSLLDGSDNERGFRRSAELLSHIANQENAIASMRGLIALYPDEADAYFSMAYLADRFKKTELINESIDQGLKLRPGWEELALTKLGHMIRNRFPEKEIESFAREFLSHNPGGRSFHSSFARYLVDIGQTQRALNEFETIVKRDDTFTDGLMAAALLSMQLQDYDKADRYLVKHLKVTPDNDQVRLYLGQVKENQKRYKDAKKTYSEIQDNNHWFDARLQLGSVMAKLEGVDVAIEHLESVNPQDQNEFIRLALKKESIFREAKQLPRAKQVLDDAVDRYPEDTELLYARGLVLAQMNMIEEHEKDMRELLKRDPNNAHALNALGYTLADSTTRYDEAHQLIQLALSIRPNDPFILDSMGWVQYRLGNHDEAIDYLRRAYSQRKDAEIAAHLGEVLWMTGEKNAAKEIWKQATKHNPDNDVLNETIKRLFE